MGETRDELGGDVAGEEDRVLRGRRDLHARAEAADHRAGVGGTAGDVGALRRRRVRGDEEGSASFISRGRVVVVVVIVVVVIIIVVVVRDQVWGDLVMGLELRQPRAREHGVELGRHRRVPHDAEVGGRRHVPRDLAAISHAIAQDDARVGVWEVDEVDPRVARAAPPRRRRDGRLARGCGGGEGGTEQPASGSSFAAGGAGGDGGARGMLEAARYFDRGGVQHDATAPRAPSVLSEGAR